MPTRAESLVLFNHDWDALGFGRLRPIWPHRSAGFDLYEAAAWAFR